MSYQGKNIKDLDTSTPKEGASYIPELNDSDREIKNVLKNQYAVISVTTNTILSEEDYIVIATTSGITITLPSASVVAGNGYTKEYVIANKSSGQITLIGTIDGTANLTIDSGDIVYVVSDGTSWYLSAKFNKSLDAIASWLENLQAEGLAVNILKAGELIGSRDTLNFGEEFTITDDTENERVDISINIGDQGFTLGTKASENIRKSGEHTAVSNSSPAIKKLEFTFNEAADQIRIYFGGLAVYQSTLYLQLKKNDSTLLKSLTIGPGSVEGTEGSDYADVNGLVATDKIQLWAYRSGSGTCQINQFDVAYDLAVKKLGDYELVSPLVIVWSPSLALNITETL